MSQPSPDVRLFARSRADLNMQAAWLLGPAVWAAALRLWTGEPLWAAAAAAALLLPMMVLFQRLYEVRLDADGLRVRRLLGRPRRVVWSEIDRMESGWGLNGHWVRVHTRAGERIDLPDGLEHAGVLISEIGRHLSSKSAESALGTPDPGAGPGTAHGSRWGYVGRGAGLLMMMGWTVAFAWAWWMFVVDGELLPLMLVVAAGAAVPGIAYALIHSRPGPLAVCWAAAQVTLWSLIPLTVWTLLWAQPTTLLSLSAWVTLSLSIGAVLSALLAAWRPPVPTEYDPSGSGRVGPLLAVGVLLAGLAAWQATTADVLLEPTPAGVFAAHANFRNRAEPLLVLSEPNPGRWLTMAASSAGGDADETDPQSAAQRATLGEDVPLLPLGRAPLVGLNEETLQFLTAKAAYPGRAVLWTADGSATAVLAGLGNTASSLRVADVQIVWWDDPHRVRTSRQISPVPLAYRGAAWSPDGRRLALLTENRDSPLTGPTLRLFVLDGTGGVRSVERDDLPESLGSLVAWRPDGCMVFEGSDPAGYRVVEYWNPFAELAAESSKSATDKSATNKSAADKSDPEKLRPEFSPAPLVGPPAPKPLPLLPPDKPMDHGSRRPPRTARRVFLPDVTRELCRSPDRMLLVGLRRGTGMSTDKGSPGGGVMLVIWDHLREAATEVPLSPAISPMVARLDELAIGAELPVVWSADGSTLLVPPLAVEPDSAGVSASALWVNWSAHPPMAMDVRLPCAGRVETVGPLALSPDGRRLALMVEQGSPVQLAKRLAESFPVGLWPEPPSEAAEEKSALPTRKALPWSGLPESAPEPASDGWGLRRALYVGDLGTPTGCSGPPVVHWRRVGLLPAGRSRDAAGGTPQLHWTAMNAESQDVLMVLLRRPDSAEHIRHLYRLVLPKR